VGQSKKVYENNGDRAVFSARCEIERSEEVSASGRERPRLRLPRAADAVVVPALCLESTAPNLINCGSV
jgi:hypothetical protein